MFIALPPSEGKTAPADGPALDLASLSIPPFTDLRDALISELEDVSRHSDAAQILGVGKAAESELVAQQSLRRLPCAPAHDVYTGVLFQAAGFSNLPDSARERARDSVLIFSALFGATSAFDFIPQYRLRMGVKLPGGTPRSRWRGLWHHLDDRADGQLVIDGRSANYAGWKPPATAAHVKIVAVRESAGARKVITHNAKHYRGVLTRIALRAESVPRSADDLAHLAESAGMGEIELAGSGSNVTLTVVERDAV